jgi:hypothetical protein
VFLKKDLTDQIPSLRKNNLRYEEYANKTFQDLFPQEVLQNTTVKFLIIHLPALLTIVAMENSRFRNYLHRYSSLV